MVCAVCEHWRVVYVPLIMSRCPFACARPRSRADSPAESRHGQLRRQGSSLGHWHWQWRSDSESASSSGLPWCSWTSWQLHREWKPRGIRTQPTGSLRGATGSGSAGVRVSAGAGDSRSESAHDRDAPASATGSGTAAHATGSGSRCTAPVTPESVMLVRAFRSNSDACIHWHSAFKFKLPPSHGRGQLRCQWTPHWHMLKFGKQPECFASPPPPPPSHCMRSTCVDDVGIPFKLEYRVRTL